MVDGRDSVRLRLRRAALLRRQHRGAVRTDPAPAAALSGAGRRRRRRRPAPPARPHALQGPPPPHHRPRDEGTPVTCDANMSEWPVAPWNNPSFGTLEMELKEMETIPHAVVEIGSFINTIRKCHRGALAMGTSCAKPGKRARNPVKARSRERGSINQQEMALWV